MSNKGQMIQYMLKLIGAGVERPVAKTLEAFSGQISKSSLYNYLSELCASGVIEKSGGSYTLVNREHAFVYGNVKGLREERVFNKDIQPLLSGLNTNVIAAWSYSFMEMMNNAIEHSGATNIRVDVLQNKSKTRVKITDNGKGVFRNIQRYMLEERGEELSLEECAGLLFAGKFTTAPSGHSGEGIFFTSHLMDYFVILSDGIVFSRDNFLDKLEISTAGQGTTVIMELDNNSKKRPRDVFDRFSSVDEGFIKTHIPIAHIFPGLGPISRSEGRRLGEIIRDFKEIDLDFEGVEEVGQAFVHELFVVWQRNNPEIKLNVLSASDDVDFMIRRGINNEKNRRDR